MNRRLVTRTDLVRDLVALGVDGLGDAPLMLHARMSAIGWVVGGPQSVIEAVLEAIGPSSTLVMLTGWEDRPPYHQEAWDLAERDTYRRDAPAFDPVVARAERALGRVAEAVRTWPGARHSRHPVCGFAAVGPGAEWLLEGQSLDEGYGTASPLHRLVEARGAVLLLGDLFENVTLLHHAEYLAQIPDKRWVEYGMPVLVDGQRRWRRIRELDSSLGAFPYEDLGLEHDAFEVITRSALSVGIGRSRQVGSTTGHLLPAALLVEHGRRWMEARFG